jgi:hypothetical protein
VVDASGLVLVNSSYVAGPSSRQDIKVTVPSVRVIFPGDEKEYEAILGAVDTKYGLGYLLIRDLAGRTAQPIDVTRLAEPALGDTLYCVSRLGQGFDYAAVCQKVNIVGALTKPRVMWAIDGEGPEIGHPAYTADGAIAGMMVSQEGVGEGGGTQVFLLPWKVASSSIERSLKAAQKALEELKAKEAEAAAKPKEGEGEKPPEAPEKPPETPEKPPEPAPAPPAR